MSTQADTIDFASWYGAWEERAIARSGEAPSFFGDALSVEGDVCLLYGCMYIYVYVYLVQMWWARRRGDLYIFFYNRPGKPFQL